MKKILFPILIVSIIFLTACGASDIKNGKVPTESYDIISTSIDNKDYLTMIPITTYTGKTTSVRFIPVWDNYDQVTIKYWDKANKEKITTDDFDIEKTTGVQHFKVKKGTLHDHNPTVVMYMHDK